MTDHLEEIWSFLERGRRAQVAVDQVVETVAPFVCGERACRARFASMPELADHSREVHSR